MVYAVPNFFSSLAHKEKHGFTALLILAVGISILFSGFGFADPNCNCNTTVPVWNLSGTNCRIYPYYYEATVDVDEDWYDEPNSTWRQWTLNSHEYWQGLENWETCDRVDCKQSTYVRVPGPAIDPNNKDIWYQYSLFAYGDCYGKRSQLACDEQLGQDDWSTQGSWNDKDFSGSTNEEYYTSTTDIHAEFNKDTAKPCSNVDANVVISPMPYEQTMHVTPKGPEECLTCGGSWSSAQTISLSCAGASHIKVTPPNFNNELIDPCSTYTKGCSVTCAGKTGSITIIPNRDKVVLDDKCKEKTTTVTYGVEFYDYAGNSVAKGSVSVKLTTKPGKPAKWIN